jgi:glycerate kinase
VLLPMSDGGDGFGEAMSNLLGGKPHRVQTVDAAHRPCRAKWWWVPGSRTAVIESAAVIGLAMLPRGRFHPFELDTFGLGALLRAASRKGARKCLVGIGGSATNDGGFGVARSLGWKFLDREGKEIIDWTDLNRLRRIQRPGPGTPAGRILVAVDVQNPLLGRHGAARVYGPQKGLRPEEFARTERCLRTLARVCEEMTGRELASEPGAGAAGGLGFGLSAFLDGRVTPGFALFAKYAGLDRHLRSSDLVITGEGAIDSSTLMGKGVGQIASRCRALEIPCLGFAGAVHRTKQLQGAFRALYSLTELTSKAQAESRPALWLERTAATAASDLVGRNCLG